MAEKNGNIECTILKAKFGNDIRKSQFRHSQDLNLNELDVMLHRIFQIHSSTNVLLKYRDSGTNCLLKLSIIELI